MGIDPLLPGLPPPPPAGPARSVPPPPLPPAPSAAPPPPPPPPPQRPPAPPRPPTPSGQTAPSGPPAPSTPDDIQELLDQLHAEMELEGQSAPVPVRTPTAPPTDATRPRAATTAVIEAGSGLSFDPSFASYGARFAGLVVDVVVLVVLCLPGLALTLGGSGALMLLGVFLLFLGFAVATVLYAKGVSSTGQSIGNRVTSTRVVDARNGHTIPIAEAGTRYVVRMLISMILFIGFLMALGSSQRRTFHDNIAGTVVTRPTRASWSIDDEVSR